MIDIHTHIMPNIDDGSSSLEMTMDMLNMELDNGVTSIIFTPHVKSEKENWNKKEKIIDCYNKLMTQLDEYKDKISFYLGSEILFDSNTLLLLKENQLISINNSKYILIEFMPTVSSNYIIEALFNITVLGYKPILAHVERYLDLTIEDILGLANDGILIQVNASSFNKDNKDRYKLVTKLLKKRIINYIASDAHNNNKRKPNLNICKKIFKKYPDLNLNIFE